MEKTEAEVYQYMLEYQRLMGELPRMKDIQNNVDGLNYRSSVRYTLHTLEDMGFVEQIRPPFMSRRWKAINNR